MKTLIQIHDSSLYLGLLLTFALLMGGCSADQSSNSIDSQDGTSSLVELSTSQQAAFNALDSLQLMGRAQNLYSTFPRMNHECLPADTTFTISQIKFEEALTTLMERHLKETPVDQLSDLITRAVQAKESYTVLQCNGYMASSDAEAGREIPSSGMWVLRDILGHRDIVLKWY